MSTKTAILTRKKTNIGIKIALTALFIAAGVLLPQGVHIFGANMGKTLLPMHLPVLLSGFVLGPVCGLIVGVVTPMLSALITGMPNAPTVFFMIAELGVYGLATGLFFEIFKGKALPSLLCAMVFGRIIYAAALLVCGNLLSMNVPPVMGYITGIAAGLPGIIIQLAVIMLLVKGGFVFERSTGKSEKKTD